MNADQILAEIRETNLSYLMLAQTLIRQDREQALFRLGISEEAADRLASPDPSPSAEDRLHQYLVCRMRVDDDLVWTLLTNHGKGGVTGGIGQLHANILMAGRHQEAA